MAGGRATEAGNITKETEAMRPLRTLGENSYLIPDPSIKEQDGAGARGPGGRRMKQYMTPAASETGHGRDEAATGPIGPDPTKGKLSQTKFSQVSSLRKNA
ncbi:hypothetical protein EYF80_012607 [Liparis tanakae]|uniref:Uncharacterized protein n=1 Tax=Liparis tanakae TaxID=230148 RepID=A0A4Z2IH19_9TELE|nr:hypothetical protein EYF80_012607 [Liparis tanakae]